MDDDDKDLLNDQEILENRVHSLFRQFHGEAYEFKALQKLEPLKEKHINTYKHSLRVCLLSYESAKALKDELKLHDLKPAAQFGLVHDVGKKDIPKRLLRKKKEYTCKEMDVMRNHPRYGFEALNGDLTVSAFSAYASHQDESPPYPPRKEIVAEINKLKPALRPVVLSLIQKFNPVVEMADTYDALITRDNICKYNRKHGGRLTPEQTKEIMLKKFKHYTPLVNRLYDAGILGNGYARVLGLRE
jgi:hypothetical protein